MSGERRRIPWWAALAVTMLVAVALNGVGLLVGEREHAGRRLPGVTVIRPPGEVRALLVQPGRVIAGGRDGVSVIDRRTRTVGELPALAGMRLGQVRALLEDASGALWVGHDGGVTRVEGTRRRTFRVADGLPSERVQCLLLTRDGSLLVGTSRGVARARDVARGPVRFETLPGSQDGMADVDVNAMAQDTHGALWFGSYSAPRGGVSVLREGRWHTWTRDDGLPHANVTCFLETPDGSMWVGTGFDVRGGAARFRLAAGSPPVLAGTLHRTDGLAGEKVRSLYRDGTGNIWYGSERDGIAVRTPAGFRVIGVDQGLSDAEVKVMAAGSGHELWLGTRNGVTVLADERVVTR